MYDNTKLAVARILGDGRRQRTRVFTEFQSHYLFSDMFERLGKGNDKGKVEGMVGYTRRNFLVPVPSFTLEQAAFLWLGIPKQGPIPAEVQDPFDVTVSQRDLLVGRGAVS